MILSVVSVLAAACATPPPPVAGPSPFQLDRDALTPQFSPGDTAQSVTGNLQLPTQGANGTQITWTSSDPDVVSPEGVVKRPLQLHRRVLLTADLQLGAEKRNKRFPLTVLRQKGTPQGQPYSHAITVDGSLDDWNGTQHRFTTSTADHEVWFTWDKDYLYVAVRGAGVEPSDAEARNRWFNLYLGVEAPLGAMEKVWENGQPYRNQTYSLPFAARYSLKWRPLDFYFSSALPLWSETRKEWEWGYLISATDPDHNPLGLSYGEGKTSVEAPYTLEFRVSRQKLGDPDVVTAVGFFLNENPEKPTTWALWPANGGQDGAATPLEIRTYWRFDLRGATAPARYTPELKKPRPNTGS